MDTVKRHSTEYAPPRATEAQLVAARAKLVRVSRLVGKRLYRSRATLYLGGSDVKSIPIIDHLNFETKQKAVRAGNHQYDELAVVLFAPHADHPMVYLTATAKIAIGRNYRGLDYGSPAQLTAFELQNLTLAELEGATKKIARFLGPIGRLRHF